MPDLSTRSSDQCTIATCFYGMLTRYAAATAGFAASRQLDMWLTEAIARRSVEEYIVKASPQCRVDFFIHSWDAAFGQFFQTLYGTVSASFGDADTKAASAPGQRSWPLGAQPKMLASQSSLHSVLKAH